MPRRGKSNRFRRRARKHHHKPRRICPQCKKPTTRNCRYCGRWFCENHSTPRGMLGEVRNSRLIKEYDPTFGHACYEYKLNSRLEEEERDRKYIETLDELNKTRKSIETSNQEPKYESEIDRSSYQNIHKQRYQNHGNSERKYHGSRTIPKIRLPRIKSGKYLKNPISWYIIYTSLIVLLNYLTINYVDLYSSVATYIQYPFYIFSAFLGGYIPYRLFKHFQYKEPGSDLGLWVWNILSGLFAIAATFILIFGMTFMVSSISSVVGKEIGYGITIFLGILFIGMIMFSGYLFFKYRIRSNVITYRRSSW